ncbi:MAG: Na/Pi cotransporter family protein [bacterium]|nr:Na/Pi cotransporter family protein [bacterium]
MSIGDIQNLFGFLGGLGMFLYGMHVMGDGMQKSAGSKMNSFLGMVTNNRFLAVALGALITAILHSSAATTVMVVGFVNAGVLNLTQAVGVIMGANIGTTVTAWLVSMSQLGDAFAVLQPAFFAPLFLGIGAFFMVFSKKQRNVTVGEILIGLGFLFMGLELMSGSVSPYTDAPIFSKAFAVLGKNPIFGILTGAVVTAIIQSSTASVGILQTLSMNGVVNTSAAIYITLGQNIGTCVTAMLSSAGTNRTAKRAACIHLMFNTFGAILFAVIVYIASLVNPEWAGGMMTPVQISMFHTIFNVTNTVILFPFAKQLVFLSGLIIKDSSADAADAEDTDDSRIMMRHLDKRIFESPAIAIETALLEIVHMGQVTSQNLKRAMEAVVSYDEEKVRQVYETEKEIDSMEKTLTEYLIKVNNLSLNERQKLIVNNLFYSISDIERVGDHAENMVESAEYMRAHNVSFSDTAVKDLEKIGDAVFGSFDNAVLARQSGNMDLVRKVMKYEDEVDNLEEDFREKHIERLSNGQCVASAGAVFLDIISNLERISDHAYNLAGYVKDEL